MSAPRHTVAVLAYNHHRATELCLGRVRAGGFDIPPYPGSMVSDEELLEISAYVLVIASEGGR